MYRFDKSTLSFYPYELRTMYEQSGIWPTTGVDVNEFVYSDYKLKEPPAGMQLGSTDDGKPCWVPVPPPTEEEIAAIIEAERLRRISEVDSVSVIAWNSMSPELQKQWVDYRVALVRMSCAKCSINGVKWPVKPEMPQ